MKSILRPSSYTSWSYKNSRYSLQQSEINKEEEGTTAVSSIENEIKLMWSSTAVHSSNMKDDDDCKDDDEDDPETARRTVIRFSSPLVLEEAVTRSTFMVDGDSMVQGLYERKLTRAEKKQISAAKRAAKKKSKAEAAPAEVAEGTDK